VSDRLEQVDQGIVARTDILDRLIRLDVTKIQMSGAKEGTYCEQDSDTRKYGLRRWERLWK
jgi:hypothetical protein